MKNGNNLKKLINKLKERGVLNESRADALLRLADKLDHPASKAARYVLVKAIADIMNDVLSDR